MVALWILSETWFQSLDDWVIRLARTARLFRLLRVIRMINGFDSLYLMMTAMRGSVAVLFWSFVLLLVAQIMIAFLLNQVLTATYLLDEHLVYICLHSNCIARSEVSAEFQPGGRPPAGLQLFWHLFQGYPQHV